MRKIVLLFLCSASLFGQQKLYKGKLIDAISKEPVAYANISFIEIKKGISSMKDGRFELEITNKDMARKIHISCLNYQDTIFLVNDLIKTKVIHLTPKEYQLEEIVITKKLTKEVEVDRYRRRDIKFSFGATKGHPWIITKFFKYETSYEETPYVKDVTVYLSSWLMRKKGRFRLRFYTVDSLTGRPKEDLIRDNIIVDVKKRNGKVEVDVSKYNLEIPERGMFIGVERLEIPYNFHEYTYTIEGSRKKYKGISVSPSIGAVNTMDSIYTFRRGKWRRVFWPKQFHKGYSIQPAISVTLSN